MQITDFVVPGQFSVSSEPCGGGPPCLSAELSADSGCKVAVTWNGEPLAKGESASLSVRTAVASCDDNARCQEALAIVRNARPQTIGLLVPLPEESTDGTTDESTDEATDEPSEQPTDESTESPAQ